MLLQKDGMVYSMLYTRDRKVSRFILIRSRIIYQNPSNICTVSLGVDMFSVSSRIQNSMVISLQHSMIMYQTLYHSTHFGNSINNTIDSKYSLLFLPHASEI